MEEGEEPLTVDVDGMELHMEPEPDDRGEIHTALPPRLETWRRRSAMGAILTGISLGLKEALEPQRDEPSVVMETSGEPPTALPVEADLGGILPSDKIVKIRPWLLASSAPSSPAASAVAGPATSAPSGPTSVAPPVEGPTGPDSTSPPDAPAVDDAGG